MDKDDLLDAYPVGTYVVAQGAIGRKYDFWGPFPKMRDAVDFCEYELLSFNCSIISLDRTSPSDTNYMLIEGEIGKQLVFHGLFGSLESCEEFAASRSFDGYSVVEVFPEKCEDDEERG